jgi:leucyl aminopeptidase (aminopeptidase T)
MRETIGEVYMQEVVDGLKSIFMACDVIHPKDKVLVIADDDGKSMWLGYLCLGTIKAMGGEANLIVMDPPEQRAAEPPITVSAAMKTVNVCVRVSDKAPLVHTTARKEASALGVRYCPIEIPVEEIKMGASAKEVKLIKQRTEKLAEILGKSKTTRITTPEGTDLTVSIAGRPPIPLHPLSPLVAGIPAYAEAAVAPIEGTAEGRIVVDIAFIDWCCLLREPMHLTVKKGKVVDIKGYQPEVEKVSKVLDTYENANNIGELGIGTSHIIPLPIYGIRRDAARIGTAHFALGRNNDIGGNTLSEIHWDMLMSQATVELDSKVVLKAGKFLI